MNQLEFATRLIRMSRHKVGTAEAATLFCLGAGATSKQVAAALQVNVLLAKGRLGVLKGKNLVEVVYDRDGIATYKPTARGQRIIRETLNIKTNES